MTNAQLTDMESRERNKIVDINEYRRRHGQKNNLPTDGLRRLNEASHSTAQEQNSKRTNHIARIGENCKQNFFEEATS